MSSLLSLFYVEGIREERRGMGKKRGVGREGRRVKGRREREREKKVRKEGMIKKRETSSGCSGDQRESLS